MKAVSEIVGKMGQEARRMYERLKVKQKYRATFMDPSRPEGREVLHDMLRRTGVFSVSLREQSELTAYQEGRRSVGLELMSLLRIGNEADALKLAMERDEQTDKSERFFQENFGTHEDNRG